MFGIIKSRPVAVSTLREKNQSNYPADALRELLLNHLLCKGLHNSDYVNLNIM